MSANEVLEQAKSLPPDERRKLLDSILELDSRPEPGGVIRRSMEMNWLLENAAELEQYAGEWLLIQGRKLLVHSRNFDDVLGVIRAHGMSAPFSYYVPTEEESKVISI